MTAEPTPIQKRSMHSWPGIGAVARLLQRSMKQINEMIANGDLTEHKLPSGERRFDPQQVNQLVTELREVPADNEDDLGAIAAKTKSESIVMATLLDHNRELRTMIRELHGNNVELQKQQAEAFRLSQTSKDNTIEFLTSRVGHLEKTQLEFLQAREDLIDIREDREIVRERARVRNKVTQDIWDTTKQNFGKLIEMTAVKWGVDPKTASKMMAAQELLQSVARTPARLEVLIETGLVDEKEATLIRKILDMPEPEPSSSAEPSPASPSSSSSEDPCDAKTTTVDVEPEPETVTAEPAPTESNET